MSNSGRLATLAAVVGILAGLWSFFPQFRPVDVRIVPSDNPPGTPSPAAAPSALAEVQQFMVSYQQAIATRNLLAAERMFADGSGEPDLVALAQAEAEMRKMGGEWHMAVDRWQILSVSAQDAQVRAWIDQAMTWSNGNALNCEFESVARLRKAGGVWKFAGQDATQLRTVASNLPGIDCKEFFSHAQ